ncbi:hypothetical protein BGW41_007142 [Actinomortierella wolfii]|nr:hypothetical protein BGW41_007142 [Actinomortierella wolfii]
MSTQTGSAPLACEKPAHSGTEQFMGWAIAKDSHVLQAITFEPRPMSKTDVDIAIHYSGICGSDVHVIDKSEKEHSDRAVRSVPGHEIAGIVVKAGPEAKVKVGDRVGAGVLAGVCLNCKHCSEGNEQLCNQAVFTYANPARHEGAKPACIYGGFAARIRINSDFVYPIPDKLSLEKAAPLMCSGISAYAALRRHNAGPNTAVGVLGIGSLGHLTLQFAKAMGCTTILAMNETSVNEEDCLKLGASKCYCNLRDSTELLLQEAQDSLDLLFVNSFDNKTRWHDFLHLVKPHGKVVVLAMPSEVLSLPAPTLVRREISVVGSFQGSRREMVEMLDFAVRHQIRPWTVKRPISEINDALECVRKHEVRYSLVLELPEALMTYKGAEADEASKTKQMLEEQVQQMRL